MTALANGKRPVVVPRLRRFGEAVDDHQVALGRRLDAAGLVTLVESADDVLSAVETGSGSSGGRAGGEPAPVAELKEYVASLPHSRSAASVDRAAAAASCYISTMRENGGPAGSRRGSPPISTHAWAVELGLGGDGDHEGRLDSALREQRRQNERAHEASRVERQVTQGLADGSPEPKAGAVRVCVSGGSLALRRVVLATVVGRSVRHRSQRARE